MTGFATTIYAPEPRAGSTTSNPPVHEKASPGSRVSTTGEQVPETPALRPVALRQNDVTGHSTALARAAAARAWSTNPGDVEWS